MAPHIRQYEKGLRTSSLEAQTVKALCLCSGEGGFLQAFEDMSEWEIVRVDYDEKYASVPHTIIRDVTQWTDWIDEIGTDFDLVVFCPDCTEFSTAGQRRPPGFKPSLKLLTAGLALIEHISPTHYLVENVSGSQRWFKPFLGRPVQVLGPLYFYGRFPWLNVHVRRKTDKTDHSSGLADNDHRRGGRWIFNGEPWHKWGEDNNAKIPYVISAALLHAVNDSVTLDEWIQ